MNILKYKYKMHKLVNYIFYLIIFLIGFAFGFGAKKISFDNLLCRILMIDNVKATTLYSSGSTVVNEEYVYNRFTEYFDNFDISTYGYIYCTVAVVNSVDNLTCYAFDYDNAIRIELVKSTEYFNTLTFNTVNFSRPINSFYKFSYSIKSQSFNTAQSGFNVYMSGSNIYGNFGVGKSSLSLPVGFTNFDITGLSESKNKLLNKLDFSSYTIKFDENLFDNDSNFHKECVNVNSKFSILSNKFSQLNDTTYNFQEPADFIWFKNGIIGLSAYQYSYSNDTAYIYDKDFGLYGYWVYFNNKEDIENYFDVSIPFGEALYNAGYTNKFKYYGYTAIPFEFYAVHQPSLNVLDTWFTVFWFKDKTIKYLDGSTDILSGDVCFYVKNDYYVKEWKRDEWGDVYGDITIIGDIEVNINSSINQDSLDTGNLFDSVSNFISNISTPLSIIKDYIYDIYISFPLLLRLFIISVLTILLVKFIIGMVVR